MYILSAKGKPSISGGNIAYLLIVCFGIKLPQFLIQVATFSSIISDKFLEFLWTSFPHLKGGVIILSIRVMGIK